MNYDRLKYEVYGQVYMFMYGFVSYMLNFVLMLFLKIMEELRIMKEKGDNFIKEIKRRTELFVEMTKDYILTYANRKKTF